MDLKKLYRQFCRRTGRDYFNNYSEMVTNLNLNPNSSRKTNLNIVNRYCKMRPPSKNRHKKASKNEMNRSISLIY